MRKNLPVTRKEHVVPDGSSLVSKTDLKGRITYANPAFVEASGYALDELLGAAHSLVRHPDMPEAAFADLWTTIQKGKPWSALVKNRRKSGDFYWVRANVTPVIEGKRITGYMSVRDKPSRADIAGAEALYQTMREGKLRGLVLREGILRKTGLRGVLPRLANSGAQFLTTAFATTASVLVLGVCALQTLHVSSTTVTTCALASAAIIVVVGNALGRSIAAPLREALGVARGVSAGQVDYRTKTARTDECGLLLRAMQQLSINLTAVVQDIQRGSTAIHDVTGDSSRRCSAWPAAPRSRRRTWSRPRPAWRS